MPKRAKLALLAVLTLVCVALLAGVAYAAVPPSGGWTDLSYSIVGKYGITLEQVGMISDGYPDGSWQPWNNIPRNQFTKMAVEAYKIPLANPATPTFTDVPASDLYYRYIEGAKAAGLINGVGGGLFAPNATITREQAAAIIVRWVAQKNGYNPATMYSDAEAYAILARFPDGSAVSASLKKEIAFAVDMGVIWGTADGMLAPAATMTRIQGAAMIIRSWSIIPNEEPAIPAAIALVSADKEENLIGKVHTATFKVTDANGNPVKGALVDFDTILAQPYYVGNVQQEAALTDENGEVTVNLISTELGTQRVAASVRGKDADIYTAYTTKYWLGIDEIYILDETLQAENNAGEEHTWTARVVVVGPGPRSTSQFDWYNVIDDSYDPANLQADDGRLVVLNSYDDELDSSKLDTDETPRTLAGIGVEWTVTWNLDTPGAAYGIVSKDDVTASDGTASITIYSESTGSATVTAKAWYPENPYPQMLVNRRTIDAEDWEGDDWEEQPTAYASATKTWIPHVIGGDSDAPITPAYAVNNTGEVEEFTLTLTDVYGNVIPGYTVLWWIQGVGEFKTTGASWSGVGEQNKQWDITDANGQAKVQVKSLIPGQTILHCKVVDKYGLPYPGWRVVKQWYSIDDVEFLDEIPDEFPDKDDYAENTVNNPHTFTVKVSGAKYVHVFYDINGNGLSDDQALLADKTALAGQGEIAYMDGNILKWKTNSGTPTPGSVIRVSLGEDEGYAYYTCYAHLTLSGAEYMRDGNEDGIPEVWTGLEGKTVYFFNNVGDGDAPEFDTELAIEPQSNDMPKYVGSITSDSQVVTDADGLASVTINSLNKGYQYVYAVADYTDNPQDGDPLTPTNWAELRWDAATKLWEPDTSSAVIKVFEAGDSNVEGIRWENPVLPDQTNKATIAVQVFDQYGNALEGYKVVWEIIGQGTTTSGSEPTYHPYAHFSSPAHTIGALVAGTGDRNPNVDANPIWDTGDPTKTGDADDDYAWGWTLNHQINFTLDTASAANVELVLDETLPVKKAAHYTTIVNIRVYSPTGAQVAQYEVTKVWVPYKPELRSLVLQGAVSPSYTIQEDDTATAVANWDYLDGSIVIDNDDVAAYALRFAGLDQFGQKMWTAAGGLSDTLKLRVASSNVPAYNLIQTLPQHWWATGAPGYPLGFGPIYNGWAYIFGNDADNTENPSDILLVPGTVTIQVWKDGNNNNVVDSNEIASNILTIEIVD